MLSPFLVRPRQPHPQERRSHLRNERPTRGRASHDSNADKHQPLLPSLGQAQHRLHTKDANPSKLRNQADRPEYPSPYL